MPLAVASKGQNHFMASGLAFDLIWRGPVDISGFEAKDQPDHRFFLIKFDAMQYTGLVCGASVVLRFEVLFSVVKIGASF